jgi:hypothetical protein
MSGAMAMDVGAVAAAAAAEEEEEEEEEGQRRCPSSIRFTGDDH